LPKRSVDAGAAVVSQTCYLVLYMQLATFQFHQSYVVSGGMLESVGELIFKQPVLLFEFRKMRLYGHVSGLLESDCSLTRKV
jgi:hypothetical protein